MTGPSDAARRHAWKRLAMVLLGGVAGVAFGLVAVYGITRFLGNPPAPPAAEASCQGAVETAKRLAPFTKGEVAAVAAASKPFLVPDLAFNDDAGKPRHLADWRGRTVLFNLWATWCVPCRKEMPALDALQKKLGGPSFEVVSVNIDTRDPQKPKAWLEEVGIKALAYYADPTAKVFQDLKAVGRAFGMPTTLLVDPQRCELGYLAGPAEWASEDAIKLIEAALAK